MYSEEEKGTNQKNLLRVGFILSGIAIIISAISLIFLDLFDNIIITSGTNGSANNGDVVFVFLMITVAMIFFLIIGAMVIRMANSLNYTKTTKLGIMIMLMFIFIGIADFTMASYFSSSGSTGAVVSTNQINGILAIIGGVFVGSSLIIAVNKTKMTYLIAAIISLIGIPLIYFSIFYIPSSISSTITGSSIYYQSHSFLLNVVYSTGFPSHVLFPIGFFLSFDYLGLVAGLLVPITIIISYFTGPNKNISGLLYYIALLIFSIGEIITGAILLLSSSVTNFTNSGNTLRYITTLVEASSGNTSTGALSIYSVFQYLAIIFAVLALISGVILIIYFAINFIGLVTSVKVSTVSSANNQKNSNKNTGAPDVKEKLLTLKEQLNNGLITQEDYDMMKEELLNKL
ncbi:MAG: hypothetical protein AMDU2_EPLC00005G0180 [Thermoplasmatales archaeon E-plasma]|jgi:uncharacterized membrane protein|nr:MAG: hypothetical protein AMDU2_EPLC00005G0180 [Thermoplasmatales archaeon E-plasma]